MPTINPARGRRCCGMGFVRSPTAWSGASTLDHCQNRTCRHPEHRIWSLDQREAQYLLARSVKAKEILMSADLKPQDDVWKSADLVRTFLEGVRGGIPYATDQNQVMLRVIAGAGIPVRRFLDLGCGAGALAAAVLTRFPDAEAVLVDFSEPMLDAASASFPQPPHTLIQ